MKINKYILSGAIVITSIWVTGCTIHKGNSFLQSKNITVQRIHSKQVFIEKINITESPNGILIDGEVWKHFDTRGAIPGHVDIEVFNSSGQLLAKSTTDLRRISKGKARFELDIHIIPEPNSLIKITHHD